MANDRPSFPLRLLRDQRGGVSVEYLVITSMTLMIAIAMLGLGVALLRSEQRAKDIIGSDRP
jgi:hypothetical protein